MTTEQLVAEKEFLEQILDAEKQCCDQVVALATNPKITTDELEDVRRVHSAYLTLSYFAEQGITAKEAEDEWWEQLFPVRGEFY